jgi:hypothetical protein
MTDPERVAGYIRGLPDFPKDTAMERWGHMGAMLTDAVLQAGIGYEAVVLPRAKQIWTNYPEAATTSAFARLIKERGAGLLLNWKGEKKLATLEELVKVLLENGVETEDELRSWLEQPANVERLKQIKGLKDKTADYLQILVGMHTVAVDRHLFQFLENAGVPKKTYHEAHQLIREAATLLGIDSSALDNNIWRYMSTDATRVKTCAGTSGNAAG